MISTIDQAPLHRDGDVVDRSLDKTKSTGESETRKREKQEVQHAMVISAYLKPSEIIEGTLSIERGRSKKKREIRYIDVPVDLNGGLIRLRVHAGKCRT